MSAIASPATLQAAQSHLTKACGVMAKLITTHGDCRLMQHNPDFFKNLVMAVISQQLSAKAADTIAKRVATIAQDFQPQALLALTGDELRAQGLSHAKGRSLHALARAKLDGSLPLAELPHWADEEIVACLVKINGIGLWTAQMFLIFSMGRLNVLALGDAGLRRAHRLLFGAEAVFETDAERWKPYCSVASWYLWQHLDNAPKSP